MTDISSTMLPAGSWNLTEDAASHGKVITLPGLSRRKSDSPMKKRKRAVGRGPYKESLNGSRCLQREGAANQKHALHPMKDDEPGH